METDADWPGEDEEDEDAAPAVDAEGAAPNAGTGAPQPPAVETAPFGLRPPSPPARTPIPSPGEHAGQKGVGGTRLRGFDGGTPIGANSFAGEPFADLEERCWLCEEEAELYDPSGQGWCSLCVEEAGKTEGWQDLVDLLPPAWRRKEEHRQLAVLAAAHYHQAGRREVAVRWSQPPFHQRLKGADLFRAFARWLAAPERWKQREAERLLERLAEHQGRGVWR